MNDESREPTRLYALYACVSRRHFWRTRGGNDKVVAASKILLFLFFFFYEKSGGDYAKYRVTGEMIARTTRDEKCRSIA